MNLVYNGLHRTVALPKMVSLSPLNRPTLDTFVVFDKSVLIFTIEA